MKLATRFKIFFLRLPLLSIFLINIAVASAQYQIQSWTTDSGLPQNTVYSILQTPDGYLWLTTLDGVARFDGVRFTIFNKNNTPGIESNRFTRLILDGQGDLWIGTELNFVTRYHQGNFQTFRFNTSERSVRIDDLFLNFNRELIVSTETGIFQWDGESFAAYVPIGGEKSGDRILWSRNGTLWYADRQALFHSKDNQTNKYQLPSAKAGTIITRLLEDRRGRIWIGTQNAGLFFFENEKINQYSIRNNDEELAPVIEDSDGNIWAGTTIIAPDGKISRLTTAQGLSEDLTAAIFQDREGSIWIGTVHRGVNRLNKQTVAFYSQSDGLTGNGVSPIFQDSSGIIWVGGENLTKYHSGDFSQVEGREKFPKSVTAISQDRMGRMWFGHWGGAYYFENNQFTDFTDKFGHNAPVYAIYEDKNNVMWFASGDGLYRYQNGAMRHLTVKDGLAGNDVKVIHESKDGATLWVGTYGGLTQIKDNALISFTTNDGLASNQVRSLYEDADGTLWIGSYDGGLTRFKDGKFTRYTSNDGLFNDGVFQILEDAAGNFWMSSNRGIYRVAKQQLKDFADEKITRIESIAYNKADGLRETECNGGQQPAGIKTQDGQLWFPTQSGVAVIKPDSLKVNAFAPPVVIESAKIDNEIVSAANAIEVAPGKNNLEINYTALSFIKPEFIKFRYKLEGQDANWVEAENRRTAYYSYLPPGDYAFQVIAANSDGVWNATGAQIKVVVRPPVYQTWWFLILSFAFIFGAIYLSYRRRINRLEGERKTQEKFSRELLSSQEKERERIAAELHDGLGQSLLIIKNRALLGTMIPEDQPEAQEQFQEISRASSQAIEEVREIAYNLRPYHLDRLGLTQSIKSMLETIENSTAIDFAYDIMPLENVFPKDQEVLVYRIVQECVNNVIKHSGASEASVLIHRNENFLVMTIEDNGRGFVQPQPNRTKGGFGLIGLEERVRILGGVLQIRSEPDAGTTVIIKIAENKM